MILCDEFVEISILVRSWCWLFDDNRYCVDKGVIIRHDFQERQRMSVIYENKRASILWNVSKFWWHPWPEGNAGKVIDRVLCVRNMTGKVIALEKQSNHPINGVPPSFAASLNEFMTELPNAVLIPSLSQFFCALNPATYLSFSQARRIKTSNDKLNYVEHEFVSYRQLVCRKAIRLIDPCTGNVLHK